MAFSEDFIARIKLDTSALSGDLKQVQSEISKASNGAMNSAAKSGGLTESEYATQLNRIKSLAKQGSFSADEARQKAELLTISQKKAYTTMEYASQSFTLAMNRLDAQAEISARKQAELLKKQAIPAWQMLGLEMAHNIGKMMLWGAAATVIYAPIRAIGDLVKAGDQWIESMEMIKALTGQTAEETQKLLYITKVFGLDAEVLAKGLANIGSLGMTGAGRTKLAGVLGITDAKELNALLGDTSGLLFKLQEVANKDASSASWIKTILGMKGYKFAEFLSISKEEMQKYMTIFDQYGLKVNEITFKGLEEQKHKMDALNAAYSTNGMLLQSRILPIQNAFLTFLNMEWKGLENIIDALQRYDNWVKNSAFYSGLTGEVSKNVPKILGDMVTGNPMTPKKISPPPKDVIESVPLYAKQIKSDNTILDEFNKTILRNSVISSQNNMTLDESIKKREIYEKYINKLTERYNELNKVVDFEEKKDLKLIETLNKETKIVRDLEAAKKGKGEDEVKTLDASIARHNITIGKLTESRSNIAKNKSEFSALGQEIQTVNSYLMDYEKTLSHIVDLMAEGFNPSSFSGVLKILGELNGNQGMMNLGKLISQTGSLGGGIGSSIGTGIGNTIASTTQHGAIGQPSAITGIIGNVFPVIGNIFGRGLESLIGGLFGSNNESASIAKATDAFTASIKRADKALEDYSHTLKYDTLASKSSSVATLTTERSTMASRIAELKGITGAERKIDFFGDAYRDTSKGKLGDAAVKVYEDELAELTKRFEELGYDLRDAEIEVSLQKIADKMDYFSTQINLGTDEFDTTSEKIKFYSDLIKNADKNLDPSQIKDATKALEELMSPKTKLNDMQTSDEHSLAELRYKLFKEGKDQATIDKEVLKEKRRLAKQELDFAKENNLSDAIVNGLEEAFMNADIEFNQEITVNNDFGDIANNLDFDYFINKISQELAKKGRSYAF